MNDSVRPGYLTTEWWGTVIVHVLDAAATVMAIRHRNFDKSAYLPLVPIVALLVSSIVQAVYTQTRGKVKTAALAPATVTATLEALPLASGGVIDHNPVPPLEPFADLQPPPVQKAAGARKR